MNSFFMPRFDFFSKRYVVCIYICSFFFAARRLPKRGRSVLIVTMVPTLNMISTSRILNRAMFCPISL